MRWLLAVVVVAGCLPASHRIPRGELLRLAALPPESRGDHVRVVQDLVGSEPPPAEPVTTDTVVIVPDVEVDVGSHRRPAPAAPTGKGPHVPDVSGAKAKDAWALFLVAAAVGVTLSVTEGARYDGWVRLHPMMPVHLYGPGGYLVVPLAQIDPETAAWADRAVITPRDGPWTPLGRAPLDRTGFTYSVLLGGGQLVSGDGTVGVGTAGRVQLGYFPMHVFGIQLDWGFGFRRDRIDETLYDDRLGVEADLLPLDLGRLHGGVFGGIAVASRWEDRVAGGRADDTALGGGALVQLELTTRLALDGRFALDRSYGAVTSAVLVGVSVY